MYFTPYMFTNVYPDYQWKQEKMITNNVFPVLFRSSFKESPQNIMKTSTTHLLFDFVYFILKTMLKYMLFANYKNQTFHRFDNAYNDCHLLIGIWFKMFLNDYLINIKILIFLASLNMMEFTWNTFDVTTFMLISHQSSQSLVLCSLRAPLLKCFLTFIAVTFFFGIVFLEFFIFKVFVISILSIDIC
jgi:hypothetical protein